MNLNPTSKLKKKAGLFSWFYIICGTVSYIVCVDYLK